MHSTIALNLGDIYLLGRCRRRQGGKVAKSKVLPAEEEVRTLGRLTLSRDGTLIFNLVIGSGSEAEKIDIRLEGGPDDFAEQQNEPIFFEQISAWAYRGLIVQFARRASLELGFRKMSILIKHQVLNEERRWSKISREIEALENLERIPSARRERIPNPVRLFVWQRDEGRCVQCGSNVNIEFDHIVPVAKGGSNAERNIQLLCEICNRRKGAEIV